MATRPFHPGPSVRALALGCALAATAFGACTPSASRGGGEAEARQRLVTAIEGALADSSMAGVGRAVHVVSLDRGDTLYSSEPDRLYTPASNLKLFTAASALLELGPDYRFTTTLVATGEIDGDTLRGDLVLIGRGDPDLVTEDLAALADTLVANGVRVVAGDVRADASWFDDVEWGPGWMWDDGPFWYWPYVSALTLDDNAVTLVVRPGEIPGDTVRVALDPPTDYMAVNVRAVTLPADSEATVEVTRHWTPKANVVDVEGGLAAGADSVVAIRTVEDPALYGATVFGELLEQRGVEVTGAIRRGPLGAGAVADTIARHVSDSLAASVRNFLKISDNLTGEQLVKTLGAETAGPPGSYPTGLAAERRVLAAEAGLDTTRFRLADGSGVSRYNLVTARGIVELLAAMHAREDLREVWRAALPIAGVDGTLEERMRGTAAENRARAKTGTLSGVTALSGYVPSATGEELAFSIVFEFFTGPATPRRAVQDSIVAALARFAR